MQTTDQSHILLDYCARKLNPEMTLTLERHMRSCESCREFASGQQLVWSALDSWKALSPSEDFERHLYTRIEQHEQSTWWNRLLAWGTGSFGWKPAMPLAAACVTAAVILLYTPPTPTVVPSHEHSRADTIEPEQVERNLEDLEMLKQLSMNPGSQNLQ
jgi:hypothetical protein